jgi:partner of Y14 and mago protein
MSACQEALRCLSYIAWTLFAEFAQFSIVSPLTNSLRKELKIRPGFTPQEDVGRFRGSRQKASETTKIPGSDRIQQPPKPDNPFAPTSSSSSNTKTKAQIKNEKRRANKKVNKNWDESDDEDDDGVIGDDFRAADEARNQQAAGGEKKESGNEEKAWPVEDGGAGMIGEEGPGMSGEGGGIPDDPVPVEPKPELSHQENGPVGTTTILSPPPPGHPAKDPAATSVPQKSSEPEWRTASSKKPQKPHPIQGGRKGPIGLAHPPPIESTPKPRPNRNQRKPQAPAPAAAQAGQEKPKETPQPRVRKEVKVRETGLGSLADRVKGLVIGNMDDGKKKEKKSTEAPKASE